MTRLRLSLRTWRAVGTSWLRQLLHIAVALAQLLILTLLVLTLDFVSASATWLPRQVSGSTRQRPSPVLASPPP
jgi:NADH:ubiquinone oxidoreductase subunit H